MRPSLYPRLINSPFDDPGLFISFIFERRAVIFDLGDVYSLSAKDILKTSHVFISHTHIDHFVGFDRLLRLLLGREKKLYIYGPRGFLKNVEGKLAAYSWNLVENFKHNFAVRAFEVHSKFLISQEYECRHKFIPIQKPVTQLFNGVLLEQSSLSVYATILDHRIPCLGFSIKERFHINILKDKLDELKLKAGPWLKEFKQALFEGRDPDSIFKAQTERGGVEWTLGDLTERIALISSGQKITYVTDTIYNEINAEKIIELAKNSDHLFIEAVFLEKDKDLAEKKFHLTARQAGTIAGKAKVKQFTIFHFSPRYTNQQNLLQEEAQEAYDKFFKA